MLALIVVGNNLNKIEDVELSQVAKEALQRVLIVAK